MVYVYKETTCLCNKNGRWPHKRCRNVFNAMPSKQTCTPNSYVIEDCNVCRCGSTGKIDRKHCTHNDCSGLIKRRSSKIDSVQGTCEPNNWYSLAPCQFCYCVNENKLVCSTGNNKLNTVLELGAYNLTVCGKQMIKEVIELVPETQKFLRGGNNSSSVESTTEMTTREHVDKIYGHSTPKTVSSKPGKLHTTKKKTYVFDPDESEQGNREQNDNVKHVNLIDNMDTESDSSDEDDIPVARTRKLTKRPLTITTPILSPEEDTSDESAFFGKPKIAEETTPMSINKNTHLKIPISAKVTFENVNTQQAKPDLMKTAPEKSKDDVYKINIPSVLDKILSMSMQRRSMVKLNTQSNCVPGQTIKEGCNNCFCLANGKLLCTHKPCNGTSSEPQ